MSPPEQNRLTTLLQFFKALGNESRLKIVGLLVAREYNVQQLAALLELTEPTVSHHLASLKELALVSMRLDGNTHWYRLDHEVLKRINRAVFSPDELAQLARDVEPAAWERKVLGNFLEGERLKDIPVSRKKRWAILKWLAGFFETGVTYSEAEVNRIIKQHHADAATLRREMIGYRMLQRSKGLYQMMPEAKWRGADGVGQVES